MGTLRRESLKRLSIVTMEVIRSRQRPKFLKHGMQLDRCKICGGIAHYSIPEIGDVCNCCCKTLGPGIGALWTYLVLDKAGFFADDDEDEIKERILSVR